MARTVKCLVWDLDDTVWDGVVLEQDGGRPKPEVLRVLDILDQRGILHAVASRGDHAAATEHLLRHGVADMFSELRVNWGAKSASVRQIAEALNIGLDTIAFIDNDPVERAEVAAALPEVRVYPVERLAELPDLPEFTPPTLTEEARQRRALYRADRVRQRSEEAFEGSPADFLASLNLEMTVRRAAEADLARAHELTVRTHQLNTTGQTFDIDELRELTRSPRHEVLVAALRDRFGSYGTIGLAVSETRGTDSVLRLLLMSCRVMSRGVGTALISHIVDRARNRGFRAVAEFVPTEVNRVMLVTLRFAGFAVVDAESTPMVLAVPDQSGARPDTGHVVVVDVDESR
ncbi:HAD-IIIC family phosphatase [Goodfellowiella coeruleoviolacea]|uniref:HAD-superfamily phosphatase, subfamily IIIC/FkbH-like domain-containing protein n=1 Tax=Goodfellowiella coeruleoviolacea TaxID=334858 RepID=A0AAE3KI71_9PSEU|nr:HAD-IIIC family phosphatase [Goodfellowiella coeruleoviolacea]MCP2167662.1 HAD-superfamily phosphatase, subfamily IIIC/FkbH-like domain-containing protein [Goodfellowiella coeruleoviolacea]